MRVELLPPAHRQFYSWSGVLRGAAAKADLAGALRHAAYAIGWKKCEPLWDLLIRCRRVARGLPLLEWTPPQRGEGGV